MPHCRWISQIKQLTVVTKNQDYVYGRKDVILYTTVNVTHFELISGHSTVSLRWKCHRKELIDITCYDTSSNTCGIQKAEIYTLGQNGGNISYFSWMPWRYLFASFLRSANLNIFRCHIPLRLAMTSLQITCWLIKLFFGQDVKPTQPLWAKILCC